MTTSVTYPANGVDTLFGVPFPYLDKAHVLVEVDGVALATTDYVWETPSSIRTNAAYAAPSSIKIRRQTPEAALTTYQSGSTLTEEDLERDSLQALYRLEEVQSELNRTFKLPQDLAGVSTEVPAPAPLAPLVWKADGSGLDNGDPALAGDMLLRGALADTGASKGAALVGFQQSGVGAVPRTIQAKGRDIKSSADFDAINTGLTDTSAELQAALNAAAGGELTILPGDYLLGSALEIPSDTTVYAHGATFYRVGTLNNMLRNKADGLAGGYTANSNITIIGGKWDSENGGGSPSGNCTVISFGHATNVKVLGVEVNNENGWHHIELNGVNRGLIRDCRFTGGYDSALTTNETIQIDSADNAGQFPWFGPYDNTVCNNIRIINNRFENTGCGIGTHSPTTGSNHNNILIDGNYFAIIYTACVKASDWSDVKIVNNKGDTIEYGVLVQIGSRIANDFTIANNTFYRIGYGSGSLDSRGIRVLGNAAGYCKNLVISGNKIIDVTGSNGTHGITVDVPQFASIVGNVVDSTNRSGIFVFGGRDVSVSGNVATNVNVSGLGYEGIRLGDGTLANSTRINAHGNVCATLGTYAIENSVVRNNNVSTSASHTGNGAGTTTSGNLVAGVMQWADLTGSTTYDPPSLGAGIGITTTVTVTGAAIGDVVIGVSLTTAQPGVMVTGVVTAANTVSVRFRNDTGSTIDMTSGTLRVYVNKAY